MNLFVNPALKNGTLEISYNIYEYAKKNFGRKKEMKAWSEFLGMEPDEYEESFLYMDIFVPWYIYSWIEDDKWSIAYDYLIDKRDELTEPQQHFILSLIDNIYSFYQVEEVVAGHYLRIKDLITKKSFLVFEKKASRMLRPDDIFFTKIASINELNFLVGCGSIVIQKEEIQQIRDFTKKRKQKNDELHRILLYFTIIAKTLNCRECDVPVK